jgi:hypothetical protein
VRIVVYDFLSMLPTFLNFDAAKQRSKTETAALAVVNTCCCALRALCPENQEIEQRMI